MARKTDGYLQAKVRIGAAFVILEHIDESKRTDSSRGQAAVICRALEKVKLAEAEAEALTSFLQERLRVFPNGFVEDDVQHVLDAIGQACTKKSSECKYQVYAPAILYTFCFTIRRY